MRNRQYRHCRNNNISKDILPPKTACKPIEKLLNVGVTALWPLQHSDVRMEKRNTLLERIWNLSDKICGVVNTPHRLEEQLSRDGGTEQAPVS